MNGIIREIADDDRKHDPWGSSMLAHFAVADALNFLGADIPDEWQYRPAMAVTSLDEEEDAAAVQLVDAVDEDEISIAELVYAGNVLHRYEELLQRYGRDY